MALSMSNGRLRFLGIFATILIAAIALTGCNKTSASNNCDSMRSQTSAVQALAGNTAAASFSTTGSTNLADDDEDDDEDDDC